MSDATTVQAALPWHGQPYSIKRHGVSVINCDSEPVQTPGCVQSHGVLLVLRPSDLTVLQVSENSAALLGRAPSELLQQPVSAAIGVADEARLRALLATQTADNQPVYALTSTTHAGAAPVDVTVHCSNGAVILELEAASGAPPTSLDFLGPVQKAIGRLQTATTLQSFCDTVTQEVRLLTGMDRVMVYKFHADGHGEVVAESRVAALAPWLGLHYPAEDIPQPAREVFTKTWLRPLPDVAGGLAELVPLVNPDTGQQLDMTYCVLRGASMMHTEYLKNMRVTAGLTLAIRRGDQLWGLIACHYYDGPRHLAPQVRAACELLAVVMSLEHKAAEDREHAAYRAKLQEVHQQLVTRASKESALTSLVNGTPSLLDAIDAGGVAVFQQDHWSCAGLTPSETALDALGDWVTQQIHTSDPAHAIYATDCLVRDYPPGGAFAEVASGLLAVPLARGSRNMILWFRPEIIQTVNWSGNPHDKPLVPGPHGPRLMPRTSFALFVESVRQRSLPWTPVELESAGRLKFLLMELVVSHVRQVAQLNAELLRSNEELDAFAYVASHDLKEPLRGIYKYAHQLIEAGPAEPEAKRGRLDSIMRLALRMDNLLDSLLHFSQLGHADLHLENVDLNEVLAEALEMIGSRTADPATAIAVPRPMPVATCDPVRIREVFVNLLSNALKYNDKPVRQLEVGYFGASEAGRPLDFPAGAAGQTLYYVKDNGIGIENRHFEQIFKVFKRLHGLGEFGGGTGAGLTIVRMLILRHGGEIWLASTPGHGSTFYFSLSSAGNV